MGTEWTAQDRRAFSQLGWSLEEAESQSQKLQVSGPAVAVDRPCIAGDGIRILTPEERVEAIDAGTAVLAEKALCTRFVPASGAASRMFAALRGTPNSSIEAVLQAQSQDFPFWSSCQREALEVLAPAERAAQARNWILDPETGWSHLPKGLIPFHRYADGKSRCSFEEHAEEWKLLAGDSPLHFTVPEHFTTRIQSIWGEAATAIAISVQSPSTDAMAWDLDSGALARHEDGSLLFRPGGHGALLKNLAAIRTPFVFIRNIDNVVPERRMADRNEEQKVLLGRCAARVEERDALLNRSDLGSVTWMEDANAWLMVFDANASVASDSDGLVALLDRPIRVAGMVLNEGAPGGGPFWIRQESGRVVPSIVESAELPEEGLRGGTHFNPVDLVCHMQRADGSPYDLLQYADEHRYFTGQKDWNGKAIRILERPGLWNGGMDNWLTEFVEVPAATFAPVKTVFDLLDPVRRG
jgi:hypothetical protein